MINLISNLLGLNKKQKAMMQEILKKDNYLIIDVRTPDEFNGGHVNGSKNIPLSLLSDKISSIPKDVPVVLCCASGNRSGQATTFLKSNGYEQVYNGGSWFNVQAAL